MKKWSDFCEWLFCLLDTNAEKKNYLAIPVLWAFNWISVYWFRIFVRGHCAITGCIEKHWRSWNMPDDADEWGCDRCYAEGINHTVQTRRLFYGDNKFHDFIEAFKGN